MHTRNELIELKQLLGERSYPIFIGRNLLERGDLVAPYLRRQVMMVSNTTVAPLYLDKLRAALAGRQVESVVLPDGEDYKTLAMLEKIVGALLTARFDRGCTLIALGGGVVGDVTGYAAASYQRGVDYIQVPTTLLAQVDSSVGGKTAVNHALGKNMIGAFHQPRCVLIDTATLDTLPDRELHAGIAEVIKYGIIRDRPFFEWLERNMDELRAREPAAVAYAIKRSCENKAEVVANDEKETGERALLNLGHTFGHAIETGMGYGAWLHGEAVGAGMCLATDLSARMGWLTTGDVERVYNLIARGGLPVRAPAALAPQRMLDLMAIDKKVKDGQIRLILLKAIGQAIISSDYSREKLIETLELCRAPAAA